MYSMLLDKRYRSECHMNGIKVVFPSANRYDSLLKQRHIQVRRYDSVSSGFSLLEGQFKMPGGRTYNIWRHTS